MSSLNKLHLIHKRIDIPGQLRSSLADREESYIGSACRDVRPTSCYLLRWGQSPWVAGKPARACFAAHSLKAKCAVLGVGIDGGDFPDTHAHTLAHSKSVLTGLEVKRDFQTNPWISLILCTWTFSPSLVTFLFLHSYSFYSFSSVLPFLFLSCE